MKGSFCEKYMEGEILGRYFWGIYPLARYLLTFFYYYYFFILSLQKNSQSSAVVITLEVKIHEEPSNMALVGVSDSIISCQMILQHKKL